MECLALDDNSQLGPLWQEHMLPLISAVQGRSLFRRRRTLLLDPDGDRFACNLPNFFTYGRTVKKPAKILENFECYRNADGGFHFSILLRVGAQCRAIVRKLALYCSFAAPLCSFCAPLCSFGAFFCSFAALFLLPNPGAKKSSERAQRSTKRALKSNERAGKSRFAQLREQKWRIRNSEGHPGVFRLIASVWIHAAGKLFR